MSYLAKKIKDEIITSRRCVNLLALSVLDVMPVKQRIIEKILKGYDKEIIEFLNDYENLIEKTCNSRRYYLRDEVEDCKQFIRMHLCRIYPKKYKYTDFDRVVKSVIKRKAIDFTKFRNNDLKNIITESELFSDCDEDSECSIEDIIGPTNFEYFGDIDKIDVIFARIKNVVDNLDCFTEHDRHVADVISDYIKTKDYKLFDIEHMISKICDDKFEASIRFRRFTKKIQMHLAKEEYYE